MITKFLLKNSLLELTRYKNVSFFLIFNLTLGLLGFFILQVFQQSLVVQSAEKAQVILGGDLSVSARRSFTQDERSAWEKTFKFSESSQYFNLFTMLRTGDDSRLVSIGVIDEKFPLYGEFKLSNGGFTHSEPRVWVDPEVQEILSLQIDQKVEIGSKEFIYSGQIIDDPSRLFRGTGFAPRVYISSKFLHETNLIKPGSTFSETWNYKIPAGEDLSQIKRQLQLVIKDPTVSVENTKDSAQDSNRVLKYFADYLGLVALVALGLCFLCGVYLLQWIFLSKKKNIAIYKTLGMRDRDIIVIYLLQNLLVSVAACALSVLVVKLLEPFLQHLVTDTFKLPLVLVFNAKAMFVVASIAVFGPILMIVPQLLDIVELRPLVLLQNSESPAKKSWVYRGWLILSAVVFWALSVWQSQSFQIAGIFTGSLFALILLFRFLSRFLLWALERVSQSFSWLVRYSIRGLSRRPVSAALVFTTMSLATLVLSLLPHVKSSIISEIRPEQASQVPALFLFDIQPEQLANIKEKAKAQLNVDIKASPLVRSRILKINDEKYERGVVNGELQTREQDQEARFRNRGVNLTYRDYLQDSEMISQGKFQPTYVQAENVLPEISLEEEYAKRVKIKMGDVVTFDVQGVEVKAKVGSFRKVRWTSFQPNFFILFPAGVLESAPQVFLTSVPKADAKNLKSFQRSVADDNKNVSIIDITRTVENSLKYIEQMSLGLQIMAWMAVLVGLFVFIVLLNTQIKERIQEMNLLQIMGGASSDVYRIVFIQFTLLIVTSVFFGVLLGLVVARLLISEYFKVTTVYDLKYLVTLAALLFPICLVAMLVGLRPLKSLNPMDLMKI